MLRESYRVLRPGGRARFATPDFALLKRLHNPDATEVEKAYMSWSLEKWLGASSTSHREMFVINNFVRAWGHQLIYDEASLTESFNKAGFVEISRYAFNSSPAPEFRNLENESRNPPGFLQLETMVIEAHKPAVV